MNTVIAYIRIWFYSKFKIPIGIGLISFCFLFGVAYGFIKTFDSLVEIKNCSSIDLIISSVLILSSFGLLFKQGWSWNFIVFSNGYLLFSGLLDAFLHYFYTENAGDLKRFLFAIILNLIIHAPIFYYLFLKRIREIYPKSPFSWFIIGFFLFGYGSMVENSNNYHIGIFWDIVSVVGMGIMFGSGWYAKNGYNTNKQIRYNNANSAAAKNRAAD